MIFEPACEPENEVVVLAYEQRLYKNVILHRGFFLLILPLAVAKSLTKMNDQ